MKVKQILVVLIAFSIMAGLTIGAGAYGKVNATNEKVSIGLGTHAGNVTTTKIMKGPTGSVILKPIMVDLDARGLLKNLLQPKVESVSTKSLYNLGNESVMIHMEVVNASFPVELIVTANYPYDEATATFTKPLKPGASIPGLSLEVRFLISDEAWNNPVVYNGGLRLTDAVNGTLLTFIPIQLVHGQSSSGVDYSCCGRIV